MLAKESIASSTCEHPEIPLNSKTSQVYNIWSLGCNFLEFIKWRLGSLPLINEIHSLREVNGDDEAENDAFDTVINRQEPG